MVLGSLEQRCNTHFSGKAMRVAQGSAAWWRCSIPSISKLSKWMQRDRYSDLIAYRMPNMIICVDTSMSKHTFTFRKLFLHRSATLEHVTIHFLTSPSQERGELELGERVWESWRWIRSWDQDRYFSRHCTRVSWVLTPDRRNIYKMSHSCVTVRLDWQTENATISCVSSRRSRNKRIESCAESHALNDVLIARAMESHALNDALIASAMATHALNDALIDRAGILHIVALGQ